jgi:hypothetical protein
MTAYPIASSLVSWAAAVVWLGLAPDSFRSLLLAQHPICRLLLIAHPGDDRGVRCLIA